MLPSPAVAGGDVRDLPPRTTAMGGAGCALSAHGLPVLNPALAGNSAGEVYWMPRRFGLSELGSVTAGWVQQLDGSSLAASAQRFGYEQYNELRVDAAWAVMPDSTLAIGVRANVLALTIARYGGSVAAGIDIGAQLRLGGHLTAGAVVWNALQEGFTPDERLPVSARLGLAWADGSLRIAADGEAVMRHPLTLRFGMEYLPHPSFALRIGGMSAPASVTAGFGFFYGSMALQYAVAVHPDLGWTHMAGIGFRP